MSEERKLAAILASDVVGFSRLTGNDEDRTLARLRALRSDLIDPTIVVHKGRVVKQTGERRGPTTVHGRADEGRAPRGLGRAHVQLAAQRAKRERRVMIERKLNQGLK